MGNNHVEVGTLDIPTDYIYWSQKDREDLCLDMIERLLGTILEKNPDIDATMVLNLVLDSSIISNANAERFEICAFLKDIRTLLNE